MYTILRSPVNGWWKFSNYPGIYPEDIFSLVFQGGNQLDYLLVL